MNYKYRTISVLFSLDAPKNPVRMISELETYYKRDSCVVALKAYSGNLFVCTLSGIDVVNRVKSENHLCIGREKCPYKLVETNITCLKILLPYWQLTIDDVNRMLRSYCNIMSSDIETLPGLDTRVYYGVIEMRREVPSRLKSKCGFIDVFEVTD
ncbi:hypothetical protein JTE90_023612 [Oedothorax gibbosus]|uniref:Uncharacterized protein n=1 Tax=Oedothorax gibbosus TaxID=931172 RepID=A0AAV6TZ77_9ARAC|nr:hypothetical protein JTE90_023612 [Oedothorax gibbosus]